MFSRQILAVRNKPMNTKTLREYRKAFWGFKTPRMLTIVHVREMVSKLARCESDNSRGLFDADPPRTLAKSTSG